MNGIDSKVTIDSLEMLAILDGVRKSWTSWIFLDKNVRKKWTILISLLIVFLQMLRKFSFDP